MSRIKFLFATQGLSEKAIFQGNPKLYGTRITTGAIQKVVTTWTKNTYLNFEEDNHVETCPR
jgi:hypothetical protein